MVWASPNTVLGLVPALLSRCCGGSLRRVSGTLEASGPLLAFLLRNATLLRGGAAAITFGHVILGRSPDVLARVRAHERVHVRQYELLGPFFLPAYLIASLWALVLGRDAYRDNVFERAARRGAGEAL